MHYKLEDILTFLTAIDAGGLTAAARRLGIAKSVVSKRISDLESALAATLLRRSARGVVPTEAGAAFYRRARDIIAELDDAAASAAGTGELSGLMRVAGPLSFGTLHLAPVLVDFLARHPRVELALHLNDRVVDIIREGYDLAVRIGRLKDSSLVAKKLAECKRVLCCSPTYARHAGLPGMLDELKDHACIGYANVPIGERWLFEAERPGGKQRSILVRPRLTVDNGEAIRDAAIAGMGLTVLPTFLVADALRAGKLLPVLQDTPVVSDGIFVVYPPDRHLSTKVRALIEHLTAAFKGTLRWEAGRAVEKQHLLR